MRNPLPAEHHRNMTTVTIEIHARRCMLPEGVLGDGSGLHRGDGLAPCSEVAAEAEIWISLICPYPRMPFGH
jgi:hypothetical protein